MLTTAEIKAMTPGARLEAFDRICASIFSTQQETCDALEISRGTLHNWRTNRTVPTMALLAVQSIAQAPTQPLALIQDAKLIAAQLEAAADAMAKAGAVMASVVRRLPDPS